MATPSSPRTAARAAAWAARQEALAGRRMENLGPNNIQRVREAGAAAARSAYNELMAYMESNVECRRIDALEKEFLALALSQIPARELVLIGGSRGLQKGGALGTALKNFINALCSKTTSTVRRTNAVAAARVDAVSEQMTALTQEQITGGILHALPYATAGSALFFGNNAGLVSIALTALRAINVLLPNPANIVVNTYSGLTGWLPLIPAAAPVAGKLFTVVLCYRAIVLTRQFLRERMDEFRRDAGGFDYEGFLRVLMNFLYRGLTQGTGAGAGAGAGAPRADAATAIDAAVDILKRDASIQATVDDIANPSNSSSNNSSNNSSNSETNSVLYAGAEAAAAVSAEVSNANENSNLNENSNNNSGNSNANVANALLNLSRPAKKPKMEGGRRKTSKKSKAKSKRSKTKRN